MNLELLDHHYREAEGRAARDYLDARRWQELEYLRGLMTREEYREVVEEVDRVEREYHKALERHARIVLRHLRTAAQPREALRRVRTYLMRLRLSECLRVIETPRERAENLHAPPLTRLAHSISTHGPPSFTESISARLSVLTT